MSAVVPVMARPRLPAWLMAVLLALVTIGPVLAGDAL